MPSWDELIDAYNYIANSIVANVHLLLFIMGTLWGIQLLNMLCGYRLNVLGIYPRRFFGLRGIVFSPFLHGSVPHLFLNSIPLMVLMTLILVGGQGVFYSVSISIIAVSGLVTWMFGRSGFHVGASSIILGYWGFLLCDAFLKRSLIALILAGLCLYYFSSLIYNLFPQGKGISWEGHLAGFLAGVATSYFDFFVI